MTKLYEEYIRTDINDLKPFEKQLKGELTIVISEIKTKLRGSSILLKKASNGHGKNIVHQ